jgi:hypothetical protein
MPHLENKGVDGHLDHEGGEVVEKEPMRLAIPKKLIVFLRPHLFLLRWVVGCQDFDPGYRFEGETHQVNRNIPPGFSIHARAVP